MRSSSRGAFQYYSGWWSVVRDEYDMWFQLASNFFLFHWNHLNFRQQHCRYLNFAASKGLLTYAFETAPVSNSFTQISIPRSSLLETAMPLRTNSRHKRRSNHSIVMTTSKRDSSLCPQIIAKSCTKPNTFPHTNRRKVGNMATSTRIHSRQSEIKVVTISHTKSAHAGNIVTECRGVKLIKGPQIH